MIAQKIMSDGKSNVQRIEYYEDSQRNIDDVLQKVCHDDQLESIKPQGFELLVYKVVQIEDGYKLEPITC